MKNELTFIKKVNNALQKNQMILAAGINQSKYLQSIGRRSLLELPKVLLPSIICHSKNLGNVSYMNLLYLCGYEGVKHYSASLVTLLIEVSF